VGCACQSWVHPRVAVRRRGRLVLLRTGIGRPPATVGRKHPSIVRSPSRLAAGLTPLFHRSSSCEDCQMCSPGIFRYRCARHPPSVGSERSPRRVQGARRSPASGRCRTLRAVGIPALCARGCTSGRKLNAAIVPTGSLSHLRTARPSAGNFDRTASLVRWSILLINSWTSANSVFNSTTSTDRRSGCQARMSITPRSPKIEKLTSGSAVQPSWRAKARAMCSCMVE